MGVLLCWEDQGKTDVAVTPLLHTDYSEAEVAYLTSNVALELAYQPVAIR
jgi:hypothetical protein